MFTELLYMKNMEQTQCLSKIIGSQKNEDNHTIILDQTIFYPQGGGQPYDTGVIKSIDEYAVFQVQEVRMSEGAVHHNGIMESGELSIGMDVVCVIDESRRRLNSRLHSAGHLIDMALKEMGIDWVPGKGYHFPQGSYVEYSGKIDDVHVENLPFEIERKCNEIISRNIETSIVFEEHTLQNGRPMRTVCYGKYAIPCGGTHVSHVQEIISIGIQKIKKAKGAIRVSYKV